MIRNRRAKIVATIGPASASPFMLRSLFLKGVDTFRLNFSHGEHATHATVVAAIRALEEEVGVPIGILQDLQGPKIRLGRQRRFQEHEPGQRDHRRENQNTTSGVPRRRPG